MKKFKQRGEHNSYPTPFYMLPLLCVKFVEKEVFLLLFVVFFLHINEIESVDWRGSSNFATRIGLSLQVWLV